jgi:hypothetical protein
VLTRPSMLRTYTPTTPGVPPSSPTTTPLPSARARAACMARRARTSVRAPRSCAVGRRCAVRSTVGRSSDRRACARGTPVMVRGGMTTDCRSARLPCLCALALAAAATVVLLAGCAPAVPAGCAAVVLSCRSRAHLPAEVWSRSRSWRGLPEGVQLPRFLLLGVFGYVGRSSLRVLLPREVFRFGGSLPTCPRSASGSTQPCLHSALYVVGWWWRRGALVTWSVLRAVYAVWGFGAGCCWVAAQGPVFGGGASVYPRPAALRRLLIH